MKLLTLFLPLFAASTTLCLGEDAKPDFDDPATLQKIVEEAIDGDMLERRIVDGARLSFARNSQTPYSGWVKFLHGNAQVRWLGKYKDGKAIGLITEWYEHLQKQRETMLKNGKQIWFRTWYTDGQKAREVHYNGDKPWSAKTWKPDGTPCPDTDLKDGNGALFQYYDNGQKSMEENFTNGNADGNNRSWHKNGQKIYESTRKEGKVHGTTTKWYENGQKQGEFQRKMGKKHGLDTNWDKDGNMTSQTKWQNGKKSYVINYKKGKKHGLNTHWRENGQKSAETNYKEGKKDGVDTLWREDGQKSAETNYKKGVQHGLNTYWRENGQKIQEDIYKDGLRISTTSWKPDGSECPITNLKDGNGIVAQYHDNGQKLYEVNYKDGKMHGPDTKWDKDGKMTSQTKWQNGKKVE